MKPDYSIYLSREEMNRIKEERGYSFALLAEYTGVPKGTLTKIFNGETREPRTAALKAIERVLRGSEDDYKGKSYTYEESSSASQMRFVNEPEPAYNFESSERSVQTPVVKKQGEYTIEDYFNLPDDERKELIDGVFYDMATPINIHQEIVGQVFFEIKSYIQKKKGPCRVVVSPSAVQLDCDNKTMVEPDVYIVCRKEQIKRFGNYGAPAFVLEVLSPSTRKKDMGIKLAKYMNAGVREYWAIDPDKRLLITYDEGNDWMPVVTPLEGKKGLFIYDNELQIDLSEIAELIEEYDNIEDDEI